MYLEKKRSNPQSKYRWVVVEQLRLHWKTQGFNYTKEQVNFMMKLATGHYIERVPLPWGGVEKRELPTNAKDPAAFESWMSDVRDWAYDKFLLDIAPPNEIEFNYGE